MQFLYFLEGQLLIARIFKNEISREWTIWRKRLHSICFRELPPKKAQKAFRGLPRLQSGTMFQVLWHNPAYHYVENKWRCSYGISIKKKNRNKNVCRCFPKTSKTGITKKRWSNWFFSPHQNDCWDQALFCHTMGHGIHLAEPMTLKTAPELIRGRVRGSGCYVNLYTSWWFQPTHFKNMLVKLELFPKGK